MFSLSSFKSPRMLPESPSMHSYISNRFATIEQLQPKWVTADDEEDQDVEQRIPPSPGLCRRVQELLEKNLNFFPTEADLPHICPIEESPGIELYWQKQGISLTFYDASDSKPERYHFMCVGCSHSSKISMGLVDENLPARFTEFIQSHLNH